MRLDSVIKLATGAESGQLCAQWVCVGVCVGVCVVCVKGIDVNMPYGIIRFVTTVLLSCGLGCLPVRGVLLAQGEDDTGEEVEAVVQGGGAAAEEEEEEEEDVLKSSTNADFVTLFTNQQSPGVWECKCVCCEWLRERSRPPPGSTEVVAGEPVKALIGMSNKGDEDFIVTLVEGSLRYPQDFSFHIQNVSDTAFLVAMRAPPPIPSLFLSPRIEPLAMCFT